MRHLLKHFRPSPALVVASFALLFALGGSAVAAGTIVANSDKVDGIPCVGGTDATQAAAAQQVREAPGIRAAAHEGASRFLRPNRPVGAGGSEWPQWPERPTGPERPHWPERPIRSAR